MAHFAFREQSTTCCGLPTKQSLTALEDMSGKRGGVMRLKKFRVTSFRSVEDSGWIDVNDVTALIGTNESGKTNLLLPLWKLNPAKEGEIHPTSDFPRRHFTAIRNATRKPVFITAIFEIHDALRNQLRQLTGLPEECFTKVSVARRLDGNYEVDFPHVPETRTISSSSISAQIEAARREIAAMEPMKTEQGLKEEMLDIINGAKGFLTEGEECGPELLSEICDVLSRPRLDGAPKSSSIVPRFLRLIEEIGALHEELSKSHPRDDENAKELILEHLPRFVYYSTYGNLDSEIYLPHVIENLQRDDLGQKELAKARTLKVLFEFVNLSPQEILELGRDLLASGKQPTEEQIEVAAEKKKERSILLQSASTRLTEEFRRWWKQGDYRFRFEADGDHFRIWVSDDRRPEEVELEGRSAGLQWFLSFYLVFLVESQDVHSGCILLLDEPGHSLHPLAQRDLSEFFDGLAKHNQLLYTTHSPFLVDADRLDRARKVFVAPDGTSKATADLGADDGDVTRRGAGYAVHAALGLSVAEGLLIGCEPVIVEGPSDQHYLTAIKTLLIANGFLKPGREFVFPPAGGAKGVKAVATILGGRDDILPVVLLDSDKQGNDFAEALRTTLYKGDSERVLQIGDFVEVEGAEIEDLIPIETMVRTVDRMFRQSEIPFAERVQEDKPIIPQIESWALANSLGLDKGWKVQLAKSVKRTLLAGRGSLVSSEVFEKWASMFNTFQELTSAK